MFILAEARANGESVREETRYNLEVLPSFWSSRPILEIPGLQLYLVYTLKWHMCLYFMYHHIFYFYWILIYYSNLIS